MPITGSLPDQWSHLSQVQQIDITQYQIGVTVNVLRYKPCVLQLQTLKLKDSKLIGTLPSSWNNLTKVSPNCLTSAWLHIEW